MKLQIGAVGICVNDIKTMVEFYRDVIGLDLEWDGGEFVGVRMANGIFFNLYQGDEKLNREGINHTFQMTCSAVNEEDEFTPEVVDAEYNRLLKAGARPVIPPRDEPYGMRIAFVADPEGNQIEICCSLDE